MQILHWTPTNLVGVLVFSVALKVCLTWHASVRCSLVFSRWAGAPPDLDDRSSQWV